MPDLMNTEALSKYPWYYMGTAHFQHDRLCACSWRFTSQIRIKIMYVCVWTVSLLDRWDTKQARADLIQSPPWMSCRLRMEAGRRSFKAVVQMPGQRNLGLPKTASCNRSGTSSRCHLTLLICNHTMSQPCLAPMRFAVHAGIIFKEVCMPFDLCLAPVLPDPSAMAAVEHLTLSSSSTWACIVSQYFSRTCMCHCASTLLTHTGISDSPEC